MDKPHTRRTRSALAITLAVAALGACVITQKTYTKDGKTYGVVTGAFRGRWYNHYERALSYLDGGYLEDGIRDLRDALRLRETDQRRARTYGLHFIDYFPNRELGIALLGQGKIEQALTALQTSLSHVDSGRAEYYLNDARRQAMLAAGVQDQEGPAFEIPGIQGAIKRASGFRLVGKIRDAGLVASVRLNGDVLLLPVAQAVYTVDQTLALRPGANELVFEAQDLFGNTSELRATVTLDAEPPIISIEAVRETPDGLVLAGTLQDATGIASLRIADAAQPMADDKPRSMTFEAPVTGDTVVLRAEDVAGNVGEIQLEPRAFLRNMERTDTEPPRIALNETPKTVYANQVFIDGSVWDPGGIDAISIGEQQIEARGKRTVYFRRVVPLQNGSNTIALRATDADGRTAQEEITIERRVPPLDKTEARLAVTMAPFVATGEKQDATEAVEQNLENAMVQQKRFHVLDRSRVAALVTEWQLVATDLATDGPDLLKLGEAMKSDTTMLGWVKENSQSIEVYARLVETETGTILLEKDVFHEKASLRNIRDLLAGLGLKLRTALPVMEGVVAAVDDAQINVSMADASLLPIGARLLLVQEAAQTAADPRARQIVGEARIVEVAAGSLKAAVLRGEPSRAVAAVTK